MEHCSIGQNIWKSPFVSHSNIMQIHPNRTKRAAVNEALGRILINNHPFEILFQHSNMEANLGKRVDCDDLLLATVDNL